MTEPANVTVVQHVTTVNIENAADQQRNLVTVDDETTEVFVALVGTQGTRGPGFISGSGAPTSGIGSVGDFYIDLDTSEFWGPKTSSGWPPTPFYIPGQTLRYVHTQASPSDLWTISHTLGGYPSVMVVDSASTVVVGEVSYISTSLIQVAFTAPFSGYAYLT